jgi:hypothetical protein
MNVHRKVVVNTHVCMRQTLSCKLIDFSPSIENIIHACDYVHSDSNGLG